MSKMKHKETRIKWKNADSYLGYDDRWWCRRTFVHGLSCFGYADNSGVEDFPQGEIPYSDL